MRWLTDCQWPMSVLWAMGPGRRHHGSVCIATVTQSLPWGGMVCPNVPPKRRFWEDQHFRARFPKHCQGYMQLRGMYSFVMNWNVNTRLLLNSNQHAACVWDSDQTKGQWTLPHPNEDFGDFGRRNKTYKRWNADFTPPKRRFWKEEQKMKFDFSKHFSRAWVLDLGHQQLTVHSKIRISSFVHPSKIVVWGA